MLGSVLVRPSHCILQALDELISPFRLGRHRLACECIFPAGQFAQTGFAMIGFCFSRHVWKNALKQNVVEQGCVFVPHAGRKSVDQADASSEHLALEAFIALPSRK